ncbi:UDP-N-acetylmuramoyl-tripeptide--D-alanyl-D-alanine ligase [Shewanella maritima]|uniref:UDP-N-acetylmuramoyl-tripeptide--D-alanyl-D- alanine ligase n=1 Tax=Shewanella maritima TaxID=2520507 RepID=UPI0037369E65
MINVTLSQLATALNATLVGDDIIIESVTTDSRKIDANGLFLALKGARFDGHQFVGTAIDNGAVALVVDHQLEVATPQLIVKDTHTALGNIGAWVCEQINPKRIALTGSNGKTTVKEMVAAILAQQHQVLFTDGNFNNDIGVPLTLLRLTESDQFGVFELGANHQGEINYTSSLVLPDVALVNNIGSAHLEGFGSEQGIATAKSEIFNHLRDDGIAIINADDKYSDFMIEQAQGKNVIRFSRLGAEAEVTATDVVMDEHGCFGFAMHYQQQSVQVQLPLAGEHQVSNALAACAICVAVGIDLADIAQGLMGLLPVKGRMQPQQLGRFLLVDDSYNANPTSVKAAIDWLNKSTQYRCLVLGDLGELGDNAAPLHAEIGQYAKDKHINSLFCCGNLTTYTSAAFSGSHFDELPALLQALKHELNRVQGKITVLVKGSRSAAMERVIEELKSAFERGELV